MMRRFYAAALLVAVPLFARMLSPQQAVDAALEHHPDVKRLQLAVKKAKAYEKEARSDMLPHLTLDASYAPTQTFVMPQNGTFHTVDDTSFDGGVTLAQTLWDFSKTSSLSDAARLDTRISEYSLHEFRALLAYKVKSLYALAAVQQLALEARRKDLATKRALYEQTRAMVKQGLKTHADTSRFLSALYVAEDALAQAQNVYDKAVMSLRLYTGLALTHTRFSTRFLTALPSIDPKRWEKEILAHNPALAKDALATKKAHYLTQAARAARYGQLSLTAQHREFDTLNSYNTDYVGVRYSLPLYSGGKLSAREEEARLARQMAAQSQYSDRLSVLEESRGLLMDYRKLAATIKARRAQLASAKRHQQTVQARYKEGLATYIEALDAAAQTLNARLGLLQAYYQRRLVYDRLLYLKGTVQ